MLKQVLKVLGPGRAAALLGGPGVPGRGFLKEGPVDEVQEKQVGRVGSGWVGRASPLTFPSQAPTWPCAAPQPCSWPPQCPGKRHLHLVPRGLWPTAMGSDGSASMWPAHSSVPSSARTGSLCGHSRGGGGRGGRGAGPPSQAGLHGCGGHWGQPHPKVPTRQ